jgi:hypothetical protein
MGKGKGRGEGGRKRGDIEDIEGEKGGERYREQTDRMRGHTFDKKEITGEKQE